jgi:hypothetical protein
VRVCCTRLSHHEHLPPRTSSSLSQRNIFSPPLIDKLSPDQFVVLVCEMGIADGPCSGYVRDENGELHYRRILVSLLNTLFPGQKNSAAKQGGSNGNAPSPGSTSAIQLSTKNPNGQGRPIATTSTVSRPRSGWCGFSEGGGLPGPLGRILGQ